MSPSAEPTVTNHLLASLDRTHLARLWPLLTRVPFPERKPLYEPGGEITEVFFPESGMISMVTNLADGMQAEVGLIGREGVSGLSVAFGINTSFVEAMVQMPGSALAMSARDFRQEFTENEAFRTLMLRYSEALQSQIMQTAACNGRHDLQQRLSRWLLMCHDREGGGTLPLTQEFIAMMLGVHRPSITVIAGAMHRAGLISYSGGRISITDRAKLEGASCECYAAVRRRFAAAMGQPPGKVTPTAGR